MEEFRKPRFSIERWGFLLRKEDALPERCIEKV